MILKQTRERPQKQNNLSIHDNKNYNEIVEKTSQDNNYIVNNKDNLHKHRRICLKRFCIK